jgi:hypothetical protein
MFKFRKLADYSDGSVRVYRYDTMTGERLLVDPKDGQSKPWPTLGVAFEGQVPRKDKISMDYVANAVTDGWATWVNHRTVHRPGGHENNPWSTTHTFHQADEVVFHVLEDDSGSLVKKDYMYRVTKQPDKTQSADGAWEVDWCFELELVSVSG